MLWRKNGYERMMSALTSRPTPVKQEEAVQKSTACTVNGVREALIHVLVPCIDAGAGPVGRMCFAIVADGRNACEPAVNRDGDRADSLKKIGTAFGIGHFSSVMTQ